MSLGKALAQGHGFSLINLPGSPPESKYPFLYPAVLSVLWTMMPSFPANVILFQLFSALCSGLSLTLAAMFMTRLGFVSARAAYAAALVCASAPYQAFVGSLVMSDMAFTVAFVGALWWLQDSYLKEQAIMAEDHRKKASFGRQFFGGIVLALPYLVRSIGLSVLVAGWGWLLLRRRANRWLALGTAVVVVPWLSWVWYCHRVVARSAVLTYYNDYFGWWRTHTQAYFSEIARVNILSSSLSLGKLPLEGLWTLLGAGQGSSIIVLFYTAFGFVLWLCTIIQLRNKPVIAWCLGLYAVMFLVWPWPPARFLVPLFVFCLAFFLEALLRLTPLGATKPFWNSVAAGCAAIVIAANLALLWQYHELTAQTGYPYAAMPIRAVQWHSYIAVADWLRNNLKPNDHLAADADSLIYLYSGIKCARPFSTDPLALLYGSKTAPVGTPQQLAATLDDNKITYLAYVPLVDNPEEAAWGELIAQLVRQYPGRAKVVYTEPDPRFLVLQWTPRVNVN
ncbi:MAG TPA: hypothetical protein V6D22_01190 [Candidatus Obscuribacterales bacterium]